MPTSAPQARVAWMVKFGKWLLLAAPSKSQAQLEWFESGAAWLRPGDLFSAVTVPARVVHAAVGGASPVECVPPLAEALDGPVFYRPPGFGRAASYTALLRVSEGRLWHKPGTRLHPRLAMVLVPAPGAYRQAAEERPWWVVPAVGPQLCSTERLAALVDEGRTRVARSGGGVDG